MAKQIIQQKRFSGISYSEKEGIKSSFVFARSLDYRTDPTKLTILPRTEKVSGTVVTDLILDATRYGSDAVYLYGGGGNIYKRTPSTETWNLEHMAADSHGNGIFYFGEDDYLYYTTDTAIGRHGRLAAEANYTDDFLGAEGGVPLNTASLDLEASSSHYASAADDATLSITGDMTIEIYTKWESLPAAAAQMVLVSKWNGDSDERSYKFDLAAVDARFGDGADGALTISTNTTQAPTDSACTGTAGTTSLSATNASFATGDKILIHQSRGTNAGLWEENEIASYTAGTITTTNELENTYTSGAQVIVFPEYTNVTVQSGKTWTAKAWNGTVGGILLFKASGTVTVTGSISANGKGFRGGAGATATNTGGSQGEGTSGAGSVSTNANGSGGGGGFRYQVIGNGTGTYGGFAGGGGNGTAGTDGYEGPVPVSPDTSGGEGTGGSISGSSDLTTMTFGGAGGGGGKVSNDSTGDGGDGGGCIFFYGATVTVTGTVSATGEDGEDPTDFRAGAGGGGAGGSILIKAQTATLGSSLVTAAGGDGGVTGSRAGGDGGNGRIHLDYYTSYTGSTSPTLDVTQDDTLSTSTVYQLRFSVSSDGTAANSETLAKTLSSNPNTSQWYRYAVTWDASASTAEFFVDGTSVGTASGSETACYDSTALLALGASYSDAGAAEKFLDGKIDDIRIFNDIRTDSELFLFKDVEIGQVAGLQAYYQVDSALTDSSANTNTLTLVNTPAYDTSDVPFPSPTTRQDLDQSNDDSGQTYTLTTAIDEGATHRQTFVPEYDPQKSIEVLIAAIGTGDWTITVHDPTNKVVATKTVVNADLHTGDFEFIFTDEWRPVLGVSYHFHLTSTVADGTVTTGTASDLEDVDFHSYYQFLVDDDHHPIEQIVNQLAIGNERYLATWDAITYDPHAITLPSGFHIRCLGIWREYLVMGVVLGESISDYDYGYLFFWNGITETYNFYVPVPEGGVNAIMSGDPLYFVAGDDGNIMKYEGGKPTKVKRLPKITTAAVEFNRKSIAMWKSLVRVGMSGTSTDTSIERGVYTWGSLTPELPDTLSFDYPTSTGVTTSADLEIGLVYPVGQELMISWKYGSNYGVDTVSKTNDPYTSGTIEFLITDADKIYQEKQLQAMRAYFAPISSGDMYTLKYKIDRESSWVSGDAVTTANVKEARLSLPTRSNRFNEFQFAVDVTTTNSTSPTFYGIGAEIDELTRERRT